MRGRRLLNRRRSRARRNSSGGKSLTGVWTAALSTVLAACISAAVSFFVTTAKIDSEDSINRARLFKDLISAFQTDGNERYALLSLWKIYPEDRRIVLITALQNPTPETIRLLTQLGYKDELASFQEDIKKVYDAAEGDDKRLISGLFQALEPIEQVEIVLESILSQEVSSADQDEYREFARLMSDSIEVREHVVQKLPTIDSVEHRIQISYAIYQAGDSAPFNDTLAQLKQQMEWFPSLANFFGSRNPLDIGENERSSILSLAAEHAEYTIQNDNSRVDLRYSLGVSESFFPNMLENETNNKNLLKIVKIIIRNSNNLIVQRDLALKLLSQSGSAEVANKEYFNIIYCSDDEERKQSLFNGLSFGSTLLSEDVLSTGYSEAKVEILKKMEEQGIACD